MSVSLDGYIASTDGSTDWIAAGSSADARDWAVETVSNASAHLIGAATCTGWAGYWPGASGPFARPMNEIPKVVFSNSLASADWGETTIAAGDLAEAITRLKRERSDGYLLAHGGVRFARSLVETGLIDEYRLVVHPVVLGAGERLFLSPLTIEPISTTVFSGGGVAHVFAAHRNAPTLADFQVDVRSNSLYSSNTLAVPTREVPWPGRLRSSRRCVTGSTNCGGMIPARWPR
jgi:dihydrofolate reductase